MDLIAAFFKKLKSILPCWRMWAGLHFCGFTDVCGCWLAGISWGPNNTCTKPQTQQLSTTQRRITSPQVFFKVSRAKWEHFCAWDVRTCWHVVRVCRRHSNISMDQLFKCAAVCAGGTKPPVFCPSLSGWADVTLPQAVPTGQLRTDNPSLIGSTDSSAQISAAQFSSSYKMRRLESSETCPEAAPICWTVHTSNWAHIRVQRSTSH